MRLRLLFFYEDISPLNNKKIKKCVQKQLQNRSPLMSLIAAH